MQVHTPEKIQILQTRLIQELSSPKFCYGYKTRVQKTQMRYHKTSQVKQAHNLHNMQPLLKATNCNLKPTFYSSLTSAVWIEEGYSMYLAPTMSSTFLLSASLSDWPGLVTYITLKHHSISSGTKTRTRYRTLNHPGSVTYRSPRQAPSPIAFAHSSADTTGIGPTWT